MSNYIVLSDTNCELNKELRERFGMEDFVRAHIVTPDKVDHLTDLDWELFPNKADFYKQLSNKKLEFGTSPASPAEFEEIFAKYLEQGKDIIFISLSQTLSGTYNFAVMAKKSLEEKYPQRRIAIVDSMRFSVAIGMLTAYACKMCQEGKSFDETLNWIEENKNNLHQMGVMDDLFFLARKGRVKNAAAFMGTLVGIKPLGDFNMEGMTSVLTKASGTKNAIETTVKYIQATINNPEEQTIWIAHTDREKFANLLKEKIEEVIKPKEIIMLLCGPSTAVNVGPGLYAAYYFGKPISKDGKEELETMNKIAGK